MSTEPRYVDVNALGARSVVIGGHRYVPWVAIVETPTADGVFVRENRAKWTGEEVEVNASNFYCIMRECSRCHRIRPVGNFCSNCGARMEGGGEGG